MKTWEAMKLLEEGKKIRDVEWRPNTYIMIDPSTNSLVDEEGLPSHIDSFDCEWEIYEPIEEDDIIEELKLNVMKAEVELLSAVGKRLLIIKFDTDDFKKGDICEYIEFQEGLTDPWTGRDEYDHYKVRNLRTGKILSEICGLFEDYNN